MSDRARDHPMDSILLFIKTNSLYNPTESGPGTSLTSPPAVLPFCFAQATQLLVFPWILPGFPASGHCTCYFLCLKCCFVSYTLSSPLLPFFFPLASPLTPSLPSDLTQTSTQWDLLWWLFLKLAPSTSYHLKNFCLLSSKELCTHKSYISIQ